MQYSKYHLQLSYKMYEDLYVTSEPILWVWRILGVYPFVITGPIGSQKYVLSTYSVVLGIILLALTIQYCYQSIDFINESTLEYSLPLITLSVQQVSNVICFFDSVILKFFFGKMITCSIENIANQDEELSKIGCNLNYSLAVKKGRLYVFILFIFLCSHIHTEMATDFKRGTPLLIRVFGNYLTLIQTANVILFAWLMFNVGLRFQAINSKIKTGIYEITKGNYSSSRLQFLDTAAKAHAKLCQIAEVINGTFVLSIINCVLSTFILTTTMLYYIFIELKTILFVNHAVFYFSAIIIHVATIVIIVQSCNWVHRNANATIKVLHRFSKENNEFDDNKQLNEIIHNFSMQILHHNLTFSAWGLFSIDSTLLQSLAEAVTTYLVILIQFDPLIA